MPDRHHDTRTRGRTMKHSRTCPVGESLESRTLLSVALVTDLNTDTESSGPTEFTESGGLLFFAADDGPHGIELWKTDGTPQGTALVKDIDPRPQFRYPIRRTVFDEGNSRPTALTDVHGTLY